MRQKLKAIRPITGRGKNGQDVPIWTGRTVYRRDDGKYEVSDLRTQSLSPPTVHASTTVFDLNPYIAASDLEPAQ